MEFKFGFPLNGGPEVGSSNGKCHPESGDPTPAVASRPLREHVADNLADLRPLLERAAVSVLVAGGLRIKHIEPSACLRPDRAGLLSGAVPEEEAGDPGAGAGAERSGSGTRGDSSVDPGRSEAEGDGSAPGTEKGGSGAALEGNGAQEGGAADERSVSGPGKEKLSWDLLSISDLVPGLYEGGLKVWECTVDLVEYLDNVGLQGQRVLDLGCGAGLLGIAALSKGAACVHFQDYNSEVLEQFTIPNVALMGRSLPGLELRESVEPPGKRSRTEGHPLSRCRFFSGPWSLFAHVHSDPGASFKYDVILSSETLYNPHSYPSLHHTLSSLLSDQGTVYLATKAHYFGVGGGIHLFRNFVKEKNTFDFKTVKVIDDGLQRCIALMSFMRGKSS
ncbi:histidine protein methyltransferase 1 homolog [Hypanus sabinus]|uniref:histidine protein methyltransferase 1 homolog n=1 Tax=Hypanus sabinus TaxID=79690 RepID=UPI0028C486D9|nr:histidine protein methyltransferase 1 homolog [Hypanus sabinus]